MAQSLCLFCKKQFDFKRGASSGKYCSNTCQHNYQMQKSIESWLSGGKKPGRTALLNYLNRIYGRKCSCCKLEKWMDHEITLEVDHKDGNPYNNSPDNLRYLCPNCHAQTDSFKGKNKGNGRIERREKANANYQREKLAKRLNTPL